MVNSIRAKEIKAFIDSHPENKIGEWPVELQGEIKHLSYYKIPIKLLRYSIDNGRFAAEKLAKESEINHTLDPEDPEDIETIRDLLVEVDMIASQKLREDLFDKGQIQPGVITADGYVKNGNRRMAIIESIHEEHPSPKWEFLNVIALPSSVGEADLWRLEAGLQLSQESKLDYGPVNELLKLKEGENAGLTSRDMANAMFGWTEENVKIALDRLKLIEQYLNYWKTPNKYKEIENIHEYFINLQNLIKYWERDPEVDEIELTNRIEAVFQYIPNANISERRATHMDIRKMRTIFDNPKARKAYMDSISERSLTRYPTKSSADLAYDGFQTGEEIVQIESEKKQPKKLLERTIRLLEGLLEALESQEGEFYSDETNMALLEKIKELMDGIFSKKPRNGKKQDIN